MAFHIRVAHISDYSPSLGRSSASSLGQIQDLPSLTVGVLFVVK